MSITGEEGRGPMRVGIAVGDVAAGMCAAVGILTALHERERSGEGQWVQTSLLEALLFFLDFQGARYLMKGEVAKQAGNNHPTGVPTGTFRTRDGYVNIAPTPPMWKRFCKTIGRPEWGENPDWANPKGRRQHRETINGAINEITSKEDTASVVEKMNAGGIPCGPVYGIDQAFNDPQVKHLGIAKKVPSRALGDITLIGQPVNLSRTKTMMVTGAPEYAEQADEILGEFGYSSKDIERSARAARSKEFVFMDFGFTEEQKMLRDSVRKLMDKHAPADYIRRLEREQAYPYELYDEWIKAGILAMPFPEIYGGLGGNAIDLATLPRKSPIAAPICRWRSGAACSPALTSCAKRPRSKNNIGCRSSCRARSACRSRCPSRMPDPISARCARPRCSMAMNG